MLRTEKQKYLFWQKQLAERIWYRRFWQFGSNYSWLILVPILWYLFLYSSSHTAIAEIILAFIVGRFILIPIIVFFLPEPRPYQQFDFEPLTSVLFSTKTDDHNSFPSRHMTSLATGLGVLIISFPILAIPWFVVVLWTGSGRVVLGYHHPRDIIFGFFFGILLGILVALAI